MASSHSPSQDRSLLRHAAERAMVERGLLPVFSRQAVNELQRIEAAGRTRGATAAGELRDLTALPWSSIDNDSSRDLDQLTVAQPGPRGTTRILVAVADVDALVKKGSALDEHARRNTTSVYTAATIFPMLPESLSTDLTSLNPGQDRLAVVVDMQIDGEGAVTASEVYRARVHNHAKLAYNGMAAWLDGQGPRPEAIGGVHGLDENLRLQDQVAKALRERRREHGALRLETIRARPVFEGEAIQALDTDHKNRATELIEDFMIAANGVTAQFLDAKRFPTIRRVVRSPKRWDRIVDVAREHGTTLPSEPDSVALDAFLAKARTADPERFPDLSLSIIKLMGAGEYVAERPGAPAPGHFGLAVKDYTHSTAPNRRYTDLVTQRLLKAAIAGAPSPYTFEELSSLAAHLTAQEDAANKVERQVGKSAAALLLQRRIGEQFDALVTGASDKGTWARLLSLPVEGRVVRGFEGMDVGERVRVQLVSVDIQRGFIDFRGVR